MTALEATDWRDEIRGREGSGLVMPLLRGMPWLCVCEELDKNPNPFHFMQSQIWRRLNAAPHPKRAAAVVEALAGEALERVDPHVFEFHGRPL